MFVLVFPEYGGLHQIILRLSLRLSLVFESGCDSSIKIRLSGNAAF